MARSVVPVRACAPTSASSGAESGVVTDRLLLDKAARCAAETEPRCGFARRLRVLPQACDQRQRRQHGTLHTNRHKGSVGDVVVGAGKAGELEEVSWQAASGEPAGFG